MSLLCALSRQRSTPLDTHIQYDAGRAVHPARIKRCPLFCLSVTDTTGEFDDAVMHLYTDRAGRKGFITLEFSDNVLLDLCVTLHHVISILRMVRVRTTHRNG